MKRTLPGWQAENLGFPLRHFAAMTIVGCERLSLGERPMRLVSYLDPSGRFDYERYREAQIKANHEKIDAVWAYKPSIRFLANYIRNTVPEISFGICHGTRRGVEQAWFREYLGRGVTVIGTEISDTAKQFPDTVRHDFHEPRAEWIGKASFIYSNSWDHAYDPAKALRTWTESLQPNGVAILEHTIGHQPEYTGESDPFGISFEELIEFVNEVGAGRFSFREKLKEFDFAVPAYYGTLRYVVIGNEQTSAKSKPTERTVGGEWTFLVGGNGGELLSSGWSEPDRYGCWTIGRHALLASPVEPTGNTLQMKISGYAFVPPDVGLQRLQVSLNGVDLTRVEFTSSSRKTFEFKVPSSAVLRSGNTFMLTIERPATPVSFGLSTDARPLGFHLIGITCTSSDQ